MVLPTFTFLWSQLENLIKFAVKGYFVMVRYGVAAITNRQVFVKETWAIMY